MSAGIGKGTQFQIGDGGAPEDFITVALIDNFSWSGFQLDTVDATTFESADGGEEPIPGLLKWGEAHIEGNFEMSATQEGLYTDMLAKTKRNFKVVFPSTVTKDTLTFTGYITQFQVTAPNAEKMRLTATVKLTGKPAWA